MQKGKNPTKLTKVLVKKAHGGRKQDSKFWQSEFSSPDIQINERKPKSRVRQNPFLWVIIFAIISLTIWAIYNFYINEKPYLPLSRVYEKSIPLDMERPAPEKIITRKPVNTPVQQSKRIAPQPKEDRQGTIYSWTDKKGNKHYSNVGPPTASQYETQPEYDSYSNITKVQISNNQIFVPVTLQHNGKKINTSLLLDTGCTTTSLPTKTADYLKADYLGKTTTTVADGRKVPGLIRKIDFIKVGPGLEKDFVIISSKAVGSNNRGLLGMDYLGKHPYTIDYKNQRIVWE